MPDARYWSITIRIILYPIVLKTFVMPGLTRHLLKKGITPNHTNQPIDPSFLGSPSESFQSSISLTISSAAFPFQLRLQPKCIPHNKEENNTYRLM